MSLSDSLDPSVCLYVCFVIIMILHIRLLQYNGHKGQSASQRARSLPFPVKMLGLEVMALQYCLRHISIQPSSFFEPLDDARNSPTSNSV